MTTPVLIKRTLDLKPGWKGMMEYILILLEDGTPEGKSFAKGELRDLAVKLDELIEADAKLGSPMTTLADLDAEAGDNPVYGGNK